MTDYDLLVVGGGISGMSFAHFASQHGFKTVVLERDEAPGGCIRSQRLDSGFWFEMGAHTCYNSYGNLIGILEELKLVDKLLKRARVPFRLLVGDAIRPIIRELHFLELLISLRHLRKTRKEGLSVREYYSKLVGERNYDRVFGPLFAAVPSQKADAFPADMLFKRRERRKDILRSFTMAGGLQTIVDAVARDPNITVQPGVEAMAMKRKDGRFILDLAGGGQCSAGRVALAVPPPAAMALVGHEFPDAAAPLAQMRTNNVHTVGVVVRKGATPIEPVAGVIPLDYRFFSAVSRDTVPNPDWRGFAFHFRLGVSTDDAMKHITALLKVDRRTIEHVFERDLTLPSPVVGHQKLVQELDARLDGPSIAITGNYFGGLAIEDCVIRSRREAARLLGQATAS